MEGSNENTLKRFRFGFPTFNQTLQACIKCQTMRVCLCECICLHLGKACLDNISMTTAVGRQCLESLGPWPARLGKTLQGNIELDV